MITVNGVNIENSSLKDKKLQIENMKKSVIVIEKEPNSLCSYTHSPSSRLRPADEELSPIDPKKSKTSSDIVEHEDEDDIYLPASQKSSSTEELSDTDSGVESERKLPVGEQFGGHDPESDDTDSLDTPSSNIPPGKGRMHPDSALKLSLCEY